LTLHDHTQKTPPNTVQDSGSDITYIREPGVQQGWMYHSRRDPSPFTPLTSTRLVHFIMFAKNKLSFVRYLLKKIITNIQIAGSPHTATTFYMLGKLSELPWKIPRWWSLMIKITFPTWLHKRNKKIHFAIVATRCTLLSYTILYSLTITFKTVFRWISNVYFYCRADENF